MIFLGMLERWWRIPALLLILSHFGIASELFVQAQRWRAIDRGDFWREYIALLLNPVAALRAGDLLSRRLFELRAAKVPKPS
jgi:hypothetical protein